MKVLDRVFMFFGFMVMLPGILVVMAGLWISSIENRDSGERSE